MFIYEIYFYIYCLGTLLCVRCLSWFQGQFVRKLTFVGWCGVAFLQTVPEMTNFCFQGQFARKLRNICGLVWWVAFLQTVPEMTNFCLNVKSVSYINIDFLYFYFAHFIGYSSGLK